MVSQKIKNAAVSLSSLGGTVTEDTWSFIKRIQQELLDAASQVENIETKLIIPQEEESHAA